MNIYGHILYIIIYVSMFLYAYICFCIFYIYSYMKNFLLGTFRLKMYFYIDGNATFSCIL